jgi:Tol biopolymer transport system component
MLLLLIILITLFPGYSGSQDIEALKNGVVSIAATTFEGKRKQGTGFIVRLEPDTAFILTASHVVEGARSQDIEVKFYKNRSHIFRVTEIHLEGGEKHGLAILTITGKIPSGLKVLNMNTSISTRAGDPMMVIGFPSFGGPWAVIKGEIVGRKGKLITLSGAIDEGNSGGPLLKGGQVVGIITVASNKFSAAVPSVIAHYFMESWGVKFGAALRSEAATIPVIYIMQMIREKGFHHPQDLSKYGLAPSYIGTFEHEYEPKTLGGDRVIIDHATGLMWQRSGTANFIELEIASGYVDELNREGYAGFSDWRLPTIEELASLLEPIGRNQDLFIDPLFDPKIFYCWSIDSFQDPEHHRGWMADFYRGMLCYSEVFENKYVRNQARAVRTMIKGPQKQARKPASRPTIQSLRMNPTIAKTKIVFDLDVNKKRDVYAINADGSGLTRLTSGPEEAWHPVWSPNGTRIAFWSENDGVEIIYLMKPDGSNRHKLIHSARKFSWSPDGSQFVISSNNDIQVINIDGTYDKRFNSYLRNEYGNSPAWSPAGDLIAYSSKHDGHILMSVISSSGGDPTRLTEAKMNYGYGYNVIPLSWSPDGNKIAYIYRDKKRGELYLINPDGTGRVKLTSYKRAYGDSTYIYEFSWSPDKQKIAFVMEHSLHGYKNKDIFSINIDGTHLVQLTDTPANEESISWSPDAKLIAFASNRFDSWEIYIMNDDGTNPVRLTDTPSNERNPAWKPKM